MFIASSHSPTVCVLACVRACGNVLEFVCVSVGLSVFALPFQESKNSLWEDSKQVTKSTSVENLRAEASAKKNVNDQIK